MSIGAFPGLHRAGAGVAAALMLGRLAAIAPDRRYFATSDGRPLRLIGENVCWSGERVAGTEGAADGTVLTLPLPDFNDDLAGIVDPVPAAEPKR